MEDEGDGGRDGDDEDVAAEDEWEEGLSEAEEVSSGSGAVAFCACEGRDVCDGFTGWSAAPCTASLELAFRLGFDAGREETRRFFSTVKAMSLE